MTPATTPQGSAHARGVQSIERELSALHDAMLRSRDGHEMPAAVRFSVFTLVVACNDESVVDEAERVVEHITMTHPARTLLIVADSQAPAGVEADIALQCSVRGHGQVCGEHVRLRVGGEAALHLVSVVTPLLLPDVPVVLCLAGAPPLEQALAADAAALCDRMVLDTTAYPDPVEALRVLLPRLSGDRRPLPVSDLAWERGAPWRRVIAAAFETREMRPYLAGIRRLRLTSRGVHRSVEALLLAGWLADRLGWEDDRGPAVLLDTDSITADAGIAAVEIHAAGPGAAEATVRVHRENGALVCTATADGAPPHAQRIPLDERDPADLVGAVLQQVEADRLYPRALPHAVALAEAVP